MATYKVERNGVSIECDSVEAAAALIAKLGNGAAPKPEPPADPAPPVEVVDARPSTGAPTTRTVETLREVESAGKLVWDWLTGDEDPRSAILDALTRHKRPRS